MSDTEAGALADAVMDWRDPDQLHRLNGAEDDDYRTAGKAYGAKDAPFESVEELQLVLGMTSEIYTKLWPAVTVLSPRATVDTSVASPLVNRAVTGAAADERMDPAESPPPGDERPALTQLRGTTYTVYARARVADGGSAGVGATVRLQRSSRRDPVVILDWRVEPRAMDTVFTGEAPVGREAGQG